MGDSMVERITKHAPFAQIIYFFYYKIYFYNWNSTWKFTIHSKEYKYSNFAIFFL